MAFLPRLVPEVPHLRRDHGNPFLPIQSPQAPTTSAESLKASDRPTPATTAASTSAVSETVQSTATPSSLSSVLIQSSSITTTSVISTTSNTSKLSATPTFSFATITITSTTAVSPTTTTAPMAPLDTSPTTSQPTTLIMFSVLSLVFGIVGLGILTLTLLRRQARRRRDRGIKREVELLKVEVGTELSADATSSRDAGGQWGVFPGDGVTSAEAKLEEAGESSRHDDEQGPQLPAYSR